MSIPRDASFYYPSDHCFDRHKKRGIGFSDVAKTIEEGKVKKTHKTNCKLFIKEFEQYKRPIAVVANIQTGKIVTIEKRVVSV